MIKQLVTVEETAADVIQCSANSLINYFLKLIIKKINKKKFGTWIPHALLVRNPPDLILEQESQLPQALVLCLLEVTVQFHGQVAEFTRPAVEGGLEKLVAANSCKE